MENQTTKSKRAFLVIGTILGWFTLVLQFYLLITLGVAPVPEMIIRYFSFFTVLTNILVALYCTVLLVRPASRLGWFFSSTKVLMAIAVYISFVGLIYQFFLRHLWNPKGLDLIADELLHSVIPAFFILYWFLFASKEGFQWKNVLSWLIYPTCYTFYAIIRGAFSGWYPYPFFNVVKLGYDSVVLNCALLLTGITLLSLLYVAIAKIVSRGRHMNT